MKKLIILLFFGAVQSIAAQEAKPAGEFGASENDVYSIFYTEVKPISINTK
jgi:hypothetical protein